MGQTGHGAWGHRPNRAWGKQGIGHRPNRAWGIGQTGHGAWGHGAWGMGQTGHRPNRASGIPHLFENRYICVQRSIIPRFPLI
ncbi:MAG: hypothetical protein EAZ09_14845 [Oscillatoriales cyanobacterium]|nr:MAG: hypothetical protein EAZ18_14020 [Oscillatoriales cyanobacterium]TAH20187.1 MAG: hypothetical protein EAZ09_14845 [Oscillatoriales cyanobacterium]